MPIQWLDVILILVMLISAFLAWQRGLTREMLTLIALAVGALIALFFYQLYRERVRALIGPPVLADLLLTGIVFLIVLLILGVVFGYLFPHLPPHGRAGAVDRTLGFIYGLIRGLLLVVIAYEVTVALTPKETLPHWVTEARSLPIIERTGSAMLSLLPDNPASIFRSADHARGPSSNGWQAAAAGGTGREMRSGWLAPAVIPAQTGTLQKTETAASGPLSHGERDRACPRENGGWRGCAS
jgi:membrane protein required for colicin V production